jgi:hypothetical protein
VTAATRLVADLPIGPRTKTLLTAFGIFAAVFLVYYFASQVMNGTKPANWLNFYVPLAEAMLNGTFDLREVGLSGAEHPDLLVREEGVFLPYGPTPAILLMPSVLIFGASDTTQWVHSMIVGAVNVALVWYILRLLGTSRMTQLMIVPFFAFGTANFYAATTGTIWFYNHVTAVMFVLLAIVFLLRGSSPILAAACLGLAVLARQPAVLAAPFFVYFMVRQRHPTVFDLKWVPDRMTLQRVMLFGASLAPFVLMFFAYNWVRFDNFLETGLDDLYDKYAGYDYTLYLHHVDLSNRFAEFDLRNLPLHLYTMFLLPPTFEPPPFTDPATFENATWLRPSQYGMSIILTSSPFAYAFLARRNEVLRNASWIAIPLVAIPTLLYYSQGWVQFGYRYIMDYLPFLMLLTALGFEDNQSRKSIWIMAALVAASVFVGFWGRYWGTRLGW